MQLGGGSHCSSVSHRLCTNGIILSQQTLASVSCTKVTSLGIVPPRTFHQSYKAGWQSPRVDSFCSCWDSRNLKFSPVAPNSLHIMHGSFLYHSFILYSASKDAEYFVLGFFNMLCLMRAYIPVCMLQCSV